MIIAVDGPTASGKGTIAKALAAQPVVRRSGAALHVELEEPIKADRWARSRVADGALAMHSALEE